MCQLNNHRFPLRKISGTENMQITVSNANADTPKNPIPNVQMAICTRSPSDPMAIGIFRLPCIQLTAVTTTQAAETK